ncbi:MAG: hypothetical protein HY608_01235 [Planctomycetes bacterium]|nr:hypothetical protein [Planctomycetota bacterium]
MQIPKTEYIATPCLVFAGPFFLIGDIHVPGNIRLSDYLLKEREFVMLTHAAAYTVDGVLIAEVPAIAFNRHRANLVVPIESARTIASALLAHVQAFKKRKASPLPPPQIGEGETHVPCLFLTTGGQVDGTIVFHMRTRLSDFLNAQRDQFRLLEALCRGRKGERLIKTEFASLNRAEILAVIPQTAGSSPA